MTNEDVIEGIKSACFALAGKKATKQVDVRAELSLILVLDPQAPASEVISSVKDLKATKPIVEAPPAPEPIVIEPPAMKFSLKQPTFEQHVRQQMKENERIHLTTLLSISARLQDFIGGRPEKAEDVAGQTV
jgi:hypothetical protein